jgi:predicted SAM-dependent methyltransferase
MNSPRAHPEGFPAPVRLHVGCGQEAIDGWINLDSRELPSVDRVLDVRRGLPFDDVATIYAEHFLEHLALEDGLAFLRECRRALRPEGVLRLSTPNLDWVLATHYAPGTDPSPENRVRDCFHLNRAFHGWGHQFLYNGPMLEASLKDAGFATVRFHRYGESDVAALRGLERHETWTDTSELPHVLIAEATGRASAEELPEEIRKGFAEAPQSPWFRLKMAALRRVRRWR